MGEEEDAFATRILSGVQEQLRRSPRPFEAVTRIIRSPGTPHFAMLTVTAGPGTGSVCGLYAGSNAVGRLADTAVNDVALNWGDEAISQRQHFVLELDPAARKARVIDMGATNPVYVNGQLVVGTAEVKSGDSIGIGQTSLAFTWS